MSEPECKVVAKAARELLDWLENPEVTENGTGPFERAFDLSSDHQPGSELPKLRMDPTAEASLRLGKLVVLCFDHWSELSRRQRKGAEVLIHTLTGKQGELRGDYLEFKRLSQPFEWRPSPYKLTAEESSTLPAIRRALKLMGKEPDGAAVQSADEMTLAEATREWDISKSAWSKAAGKAPDEPGYLPTRKVGSNRFVKRADAEYFARNYEARREQRAVGSKRRPDRRET